MQNRRTKIICTIGPSTAGVDNLVRLIESGMDAARLNFSHGTHEDHLNHIINIRQASRLTGKSIAILQDLQGPKIRTGHVLNDAVTLIDGQTFSITADELEVGDEQCVGTTYKNLVKEVKPGNTILLDDGYLILHVDKVEGNDIISTVVKGGILKNNKGIITPGVSSSAPTLSEKDLDDLKFGLNAGVDAVALSFVRSERDVIELRIAMKIFGRSVGIVSKIERFEGYQDIEDIILESDGIMIARGDLGLELPAEQVPIIQKEIIKKCNYHGRPVIVATQMLESMITNPRPTRAEASDVANAVLDGTDCVMLSAETSTGSYPFDAVSYMDRIIYNIEETYPVSLKDYEIPQDEMHNISDALGKASCLIAEQISASAIVTLTSSGYTAKNIAKYRPKFQIISLTDNENTMRRMSFVWGVKSILLSEEFQKENIYDNIKELLVSKNLINKNENIVFVSGLSSGKVMPENMIKVLRT